MPPAFREAVRTAGRALDAAGYEVVEKTPPDIDLITTVWEALMHLGLSDDLPILRQLMTPAAVRLLEEIISRPVLPVGAAFVERRRIQREWSAFFADYSVVVGPTWCDAQFPHDADIDPETGTDTTVRRLPFVIPGNVLGIPSTAVPAGLGDAGLPLGVQVYADLWRDDLTLAAAQVVEDALGSLTPIDPRGTGIS